jgi:ABC-type cobalt transport system substrate-binding protein
MKWWKIALIISIIFFVLNLVLSIIHTGVILEGKITEEQVDLICQKYGQMLGISLVLIWIALYSARRKPTSRIRIAIVLVAAMMATVNAVIWSQFVGGDTHDKLAIKTAAELLMQNPEELKQKRNFDSKTYGKWVPFLSWTNSTMIEGTNMRLNLENELNSIADILNAENYSSREGITKSQNTLNKFIQAVDKYEPLFASVFDKQLAELEELPMPSRSDKEAVITGFKKSIEDIRGYYKEFFGIEKKFCNEAKKLLEFLSSRQGQYLIKDGNIEFSSDEDTNAYNALAENLDSFVKAEEECLQLFQQKRAEKIKDIEKIFNKMSTK